MNQWLRNKLQQALKRMESNLPPEKQGDSKTELDYLAGQLAQIEQDEATLNAMLAREKGSFHHSIASSTTTHAQSIEDRKTTLLARIRTLESKPSGE